MPDIYYENLHDFANFDNFDYENYRVDEVSVLQPQLELLGYTNIQWMAGETDSFGPLTRVCKAVNPHTLSFVWFVYG